MTARIGALAAALLAAAWAHAEASAAPAGVQVELIDARTPWRVYVVQGASLVRRQGVLERWERDRGRAFDPAEPGEHLVYFSPLPPADWMRADFDDHYWPRYEPDELAECLGGYGAGVTGGWLSLLCLRTRFGISDAARTGELKVTVTCVGGGVVYVNGREVGRGFVAAGPLAPLAPAVDYPIEAYTTPDGSTPLPGLRFGSEPEPRLLGRYRERVRTFTVDVPARALKKGANVLAVELHRSAAAGPMDRRAPWNHVGVNQVSLSGAGRAGVVPYAEAAGGTRLWSATPVEPVSETVPATSSVGRKWSFPLVWLRGVPVRGVQVGNPFDPVLPIRMPVPRGGVCSGQAVLSDPSGLRGVQADLAPLRGAGGATIPPGGIQVRYAVQRAGVPYCDALMESPPAGAKTLPVWLVIQVGKDQAPGWYTSTLRCRANGRGLTVPVQVLVSGCPAGDEGAACPVSLTQSPETLALYYKTQPWSEPHWRLMARSLMLMGQVGNRVIHVPVILGTFRVGRGLTPSRVNRQDWRLPMVRWVKTASGLRPEFSLVEKYLDVYLKYCAPPRALCLYIWDSAYARAMADFYEGRRIPSRAGSPQAEPKVQQWDPQTHQTSEMPAPYFTDEGAEQFWRPVFEGVRAIVKKRGWSERIILLSLGGDLRPDEKTGGLLRQWVPYARWNLLSHFSGDPAPRDGKLIAGGGLEVGLKEWPWLICGGALPIDGWEERVRQPRDFLEMPTARWHHHEWSPPIVFRTLPLVWGSVARLGLDFWLPGAGGGPSNTSFFVHVNALTAPGPAGAVATVRLQMLREGAQDVRVRTAMIRAYLKLPEERRGRYRTLLDEFRRRVAVSARSPSNSELSYDWVGYVARVYQAGAELAGAKTEATWEDPP